MGMFLQQACGEPFGFAAQDEDVARLKSRAPDQPRAIIFDKPESAARQFFHELGPVVDRFPVEQGPVIHSGSAEVFGVEEEAERADQPQLGADRDTRAPDVSRVLRDVGLIEHHMQQWRGSRRRFQDFSTVAHAVRVQP